MLKKIAGKILLRKSSAEKHAIVFVEQQNVKVSSTKETEKNSITSGSIVPEVWIMSGLLLSLVTQIGYVNRRDLK